MIPAFVLCGIIVPPKAGSVRRLYYYWALASIMIIFSACQSSGSGKDTPTDSLTHYTLPAPQPVSKATTERIRNACAAWYDTALKQKGFNGGMIVARNGNIIFEKYEGTIHLPGKDTITANTPMQIASTSKTFTAMAVLKLWQDGKLSLDDEYNKYFPQFNYPGITIRTLLDHRSGLPNYIYFMENLGWDKSKYVSNEDVLNYLVTRKAELENIAPPDTHFSYSNTNYALLALLIEKISGKKLSEFLKNTFFIPLRMVHSSVYTLADINKMNPSYDWKGRLMTINFLDMVYGDKNVYTTPQDLLLWDRALTSNLIFKPETLQQAYTPYSNEKAGTRNYGLGWRMNIYPDGKKMIYHNGWWHGSNATFIRLIHDSATIILIGNKFTRAIYHAKILANLFGDYYATEEEEETDNVKSSDNDTLSKKLMPAVPRHNTSNKDSLLIGRLKDRNPELKKQPTVKKKQ